MHSSTPGYRRQKVQIKDSKVCVRTINVQSIRHYGHFGPFRRSEVHNFPVFNGMDSSTPAASTNHFVSGSYSCEPPEALSRTSASLRHFGSPYFCAPSCDAMADLSCCPSAARQGWQFGHQYVERACSPCLRLRMLAQQRRHSFPSRP